MSNCFRPLLLAPPERLFRSSLGLSFGAAGLFMVASRRCEEAEGRLPAASYRVFNEDLLPLQDAASEDARSQEFSSSPLLLFMLGGPKVQFFFPNVYTVL